MSGGRRAVLSALFALLAVGGMLYFFMSVGDRTRTPLDEVAMDPTRGVAERGEGRALHEGVVSEPSPTEVPEEPPELESVTEVPWTERPIEEVLAEAGEDPGAVFYMSRIRESMREGSPSFARELLRQMKERHPGSVLVEEAEGLIQRSR